MYSLADAVILGLVEGLTEFLPVSSTGHLILANAVLGLEGRMIATFDVVIQLGAILAVALLYRRRFWMLVRPAPEAAFSGLRGLTLLALTSLPASLVGLLAHDVIKGYLFNPASVAWALGVGALAILAVEAMRPRTRFAGLDDITPLLALGIGCFQCLALWPGFSSSAATIMGGMLLGCDRKLSAEYSFIAAVPIMIAATGYDFLKSASVFGASELVFLGVGFVVSFASAWVAVKGFIALLSRLTLRPFAWYRLALTAAVFAILV